MTTAARTIVTKGFDMSSADSAARWTGILYIITFITSIPALLLFGPVLNDADYVLSGGADHGVRLHRRRHPRRPLGRDIAAGLRGNDRHRLGNADRPG